MSVVLYHNARCSKSRELLDLLEERGVAFDRVDYLDAPLSQADLGALLAALPGSPGELVRKDKRFVELGLDAARYADSAASVADVVELLRIHPELMQRPILRVGDRAAIGRPAERALALL